MVHVHEYDDRRHVTMIDQEHKLLFGYEMNKGPVRVIKISFSFKYHREVHRIVNSIGLNNEHRASIELKIEQLLILKLIEIRIQSYIYLRT